MDRATRTLFLSLVRRSAPVLLTQMGLTALLCFLLRDVSLDLGQRGFRPRGELRTLVDTGSEEFLMGLLLVGVNALVAGGYVLLIHSDAKRLKVGLPMRVFLLPMSYAKILMVHVGFGALAVAAAVSVAAIGTQTALESPINWWLPVFFCTNVFFILQAWAFTLAERTQLVSVGSLAGIVAVVAYVVRLEAVGTFLTQSSASVLLALTAGVAAVCTGLTWRFGRDMRHSAFDVPARSRGVRSTEKPAFSSPFAAQVWYEWRRVGWVLPVVSTTSLAGFFVGMPIVVALFMGSDVTGHSSWVGYTEFFTIQWETSVHLMVTAIQTTAVAASVLSGAYAMLLSGEWRGRSTFLRSRPLRTSRLSAARLTAMAGSALLAVGLMMLLTFGISAMVGLSDMTFKMAQYLRVGFVHVPRPLVLAFFWGTILAALWMGLWIGECAVVATAYALPAMVLYALAYVAVLFDNNTAMIAFAENGTVWIGSVATIGLTAGLATYAAGRNLVPPSRFAIAFAAYAVYFGAFLYYGLDFRIPKIQDFVIAQDWAVPFPHPINWPLWVGLSVLPILPLFSYPVQLARWRTT